MGEKEGKMKLSPKNRNDVITYINGLMGMTGHRIPPVLVKSVLIVLDNYDAVKGTKEIIDSIKEVKNLSPRMAADIECIINWSLWATYELDLKEEAEELDRAWRMYREWALDFFKGEKLTTYIMETD